MEFRDILNRRRMHRAFLPDAIPRDQIDRIAGTIVRAPSGGFSQGQSIVIVTEPALRAEIGRRFEDDTGLIAGAPVLMVISANEEHYHARYNEADKLAATGGVEVTWPVPYWFVDAGALMMLILLAAIDEGLAGVFIGHPDQKQIFDDLLGLPPEVVPIGLALMGKPAEDPDAERATAVFKERRRPREETVRWERWS
jgi:FMN reductase [NAD(P)H]